MSCSCIFWLRERQRKRTKDPPRHQDVGNAVCVLAVDLYFLFLFFHTAHEPLRRAVGKGKRSLKKKIRDLDPGTDIKEDFTSESRFAIFLGARVNLSFSFLGIQLFLSHSACCVP